MEVELPQKPSTLLAPLHVEPAFELDAPVICAVAGRPPASTNNPTAVVVMMRRPLDFDTPMIPPKPIARRTRQAQSANLGEGRTTRGPHTVKKIRWFSSS
jgi:hypothetical protein